MFTVEEIGTTAPATKLHIERSESDSENLMLRLRDSTANTVGDRIGIEGYWNTVPAGDIEFELTNTLSGASAIVFSPHSASSTKNEAMRIDAAGNVGIGTTSPDSDAKLQVHGNMNFGAPGTGNNTSGRFISIEGNTDSTGEGSGRIFFAEHNSSSAGMSKYGMSLGYRGGSASVTGGDGNAWTGLSSINNGEWGMYGHDNSAAGAVIMRGPRSGAHIYLPTAKLGIGTNAPESLLHLDGTTGQIAQMGTGNSTYSLHFADDRAMVGHVGGAATLQGGSGGKFVRFCVNNGTFGSGEVARFDTNGDFGIGNTAPAAKLDIIEGTGAGSTEADKKLLQRYKISGGTGNQIYDSTYHVRNNDGNTTWTGVNWVQGWHVDNVSPTVGFQGQSGGGAGLTAFQEVDLQAGTRFFGHGNDYIMTIDGTNDRVGIGTTSPGAKLAIEQTDGAVHGLKVYRNDSSTSTPLVYIVDDSVYVDSPTLHVKNDRADQYGYAALLEGRVGIGITGNMVTAPDQVLHVEGSVLIDAYNQGKTTLASNYTDGATSLVLTDASTFNEKGTGTINGVEFSWTAKSSNTLTVPDLNANYTAGVTVAADTGLFFREGSENDSQPSITIYDQSNAGDTRDDLSINAYSAIRMQLNDSAELLLTDDSLSLTPGNEDVAGYKFRGRNDLGMFEGSYHLALKAPENVYVQIDSNANNTNKAFIVQKDGSGLGNGTELFRVQEDGKVGIGTTSPKR